jgi:O-glycosyl hydrolase
MGGAQGNAGQSGGGSGAGAGAGGASSGGTSAGASGAGGANGGVGGGAAGLGGATAGLGGSPGNPTSTFTVDPAQRYQTTEGWGTSLCWFGNVLGGWSEAKRNEIANLLFDPDTGLALNVVRYNIGGGEAPSHTHMGVGKEMPGFKPTETGAYDWNADQNQRRLLDLAIARIPPSRLILEAFSNSPPYWMTTSGCASGASGGASNLKSDYYDDFADYLGEVVLHFRDAFGVTFRTLEPLNEPIADWWQVNGAQEGCHFDRAQQATLLRQIRATLDQKGLSSVRLSAPDESSLDETVDSWASYDTATKAVVYQINTHAYSGSRRADLRAAATRDSKKFWSSEIDGSGAPAPFDVFPHNHTDIAPGLDLANRITKDLREMHVDAWVIWQAVESEQAQTSLNKNWGLIHADYEGTSESFSFTKKFYVMRQYTHHIRPGYVMVDVTQADAVAFVSASDARLVIVQRNAATTSSIYGYDLTRFTSVGTRAAVYRTSSSESYQRLADLPVTSQRLVASIAAQSVTTFVVDGISLPP